METALLLHTVTNSSLYAARRIRCKNSENLCTQKSLQQFRNFVAVSAFCVQLREGGVQLHENSMLLRGSGVDAALWLRVAACSRHEGDVEAAGKMRGVCVEAACSGMDEAFGCTVCT